MGLFSDDSCGDMFDFDGDRMTSLDEELMAYSFFEKMRKQETCGEEDSYINDHSDEEDENGDILLSGSSVSGYVKPLHGKYSKKYLPAKETRPDSADTNEGADPALNLPVEDTNIASDAPISLESYIMLRHVAVRDIISHIIGFFIINLLPASFIYVGFFKRQPKDKYSWFVTFLGIVGILGSCIFLLASGSAVADEIKKIRQYRARYNLSLSEKEKKAVHTRNCLFRRL